MTKLPVWIERRGGLDFSCTKCGGCCTGAPGYVWVDLPEVERLAAHLRLGLDAFGVRFLRRVGARASLLEKANGDCVFFEPGRGCTVYEARPAQCRTYPFWPEVVASRETWRAEAGKCPGIRAGGRRYTPEEVLALMNGGGETAAAPPGEAVPPADRLSA